MFLRKAGVLAALPVLAFGLAGCSVWHGFTGWTDGLGNHLPVYNEQTRCQGGNFCLGRDNKGRQPSGDVPSPTNPPSSNPPSSNPPSSNPPSSNLMERRTANPPMMSVAPPTPGGEQPGVPATSPAPQAMPPGMPPMPSPEGADAPDAPTPLPTMGKDGQVHFPLPVYKQEGNLPPGQQMKPWEANPDWQKDLPEQPVLDSAKAAGIW